MTLPSPRSSSCRTAGRNIGAKGSEISRYLTQRKVDHTLIVGVGDPSETQTVGVSRIEAPERAFQKDPFKIRATVVSQGYDALTLTVKLVEVPEGGGAGTIVQQKQVPITDQQQAADLDFENIKVDQPGIRNYRVEVVPPTGEPFNSDRHTKQARVEILAEKTKVLLLAGSPLHEYQILRQLLTRDSTIDLACWLESADTNFLQDGNTNLKQLPSDRKELEAFDVFIIMDPDPNLLEREFCEMVARQVEEDGSGLWWICGEKYSLEALEPGASTTPIADILPVIPHLQLAKTIFSLGRGFGRPYPYELTPQGRDHQAMRLVDSDKGPQRDHVGPASGLALCVPGHAQQAGGTDPRRDRRFAPVQRDVGSHAARRDALHRCGPRDVHRHRRDLPLAFSLRRAIRPLLGQGHPLPLRGAPHRG